MCFFCLSDLFYDIFKKQKFWCHLPEGGRWTNLLAASVQRLLQLVTCLRNNWRLYLGGYVQRVLVLTRFIHLHLAARNFQLVNRSSNLNAAFMCRNVGSKPAMRLSNPIWESLLQLTYHKCNSLIIKLCANLVRSSLCRQATIQLHKWYIQLNPMISPPKKHHAKIGMFFFPLCQEFSTVRGGHLDMAILGAYQIAQKGDLANWLVGSIGGPVVGGAIDFVYGAKKDLRRRWTCNKKLRSETYCTMYLSTHRSELRNTRLYQPCCCWWTFCSLGKTRFIKFCQFASNDQCQAQTDLFWICVFVALRKRMNGVFICDYIRSPYWPLKWCSFLSSRRCSCTLMQKYTLSKINIKSKLFLIRYSTNIDFKNIFYFFIDILVDYY